MTRSCSRRGVLSVFAPAITDDLLGTQSRSLLFCSSP